MLRRILTIGLIVLGVAAIALAAASASVWRSSETVTADLPDRPDEPLVITDAGVLDVVADQVTITVTDPDGGPVVVAVGREGDVLGWVGETPHARITGLATLTDLAAGVETGEGPAASPQGSDMWVIEATGDGVASIEWTHPGGRWSLLAATDSSAPAPQVELSWPQEVTTPFLVPGVVLGSVLLLAGLGLAGTSYLERREVRRRDEALAERAATGDLPAVAPAPEAAPDSQGETSAGSGSTAGPDAPTVILTRRQLRELAAAQAAEPRNRPDAEPEADVVGAQEPAAPVPPGAPESPWRRAWGMREAGIPPAEDGPLSEDGPPAEDGSRPEDDEANGQARTNEEGKA